MACPSLANSHLGSQKPGFPCMMGPRMSEQTIYYFDNNDARV